MSSDDGDRAPRVSVVIEGYNESLDLGSADDVMEGLRTQRFPLGDVEVLLVGSRDQCAHWSERFGAPHPFRAIRTVEAEGQHYYALKNRGADAARGEIVALLDSDVIPEPAWLPTLVASIESGVDVSGGLSLFRGEDGRPPDHPVLRAAASISWGFVLGPDAGDGRLEAAGFLSHNVGFRAGVLERFRYREDLGRTCAGSLLFDELCEAETRIRIDPRQRVAHVFDERWWLTRLHQRFGYEVHRLKRLDDDAAHRWVTRWPLLEPLLTSAWHVALDLRRWWRFGRCMGTGAARRLATYPLLLLLSVAARGSEAVGMYRTQSHPRAMEAFARSN